MIAATTGFGIRATAVKDACSAAERVDHVLVGHAAISLTSAPAAKTFSPP